MSASVPVYVGSARGLATIRATVLHIMTGNWCHFGSVPMIQGCRLKDTWAVAHGGHVLARHSFVRGRKRLCIFSSPMFRH